MLRLQALLSYRKLVTSKKTIVKSAIVFLCIILGHQILNVMTSNRLSHEPRGMSSISSVGPVSKTAPPLITISQTNHIKVTNSSLTQFQNIRTTKKTPRPLAVRKGMKAVQHDVPLKTILFWTKYYKDSYFGIRGSGREPFLSNHCKVNTCSATNDVAKVKDADAIVLHMRDPMYPFPTRRDERQLFVFFLHEAPPASFYNYHYSLRPDHAKIFNVTISYRRDSDISTFYCGTLRPHRRPHEYQLKTFEQKTRNVVWMSSHCRTDSKRELYIRALAKFIDVDVYGRCGDMTCPKSEGVECEKNFQFKYKFFVAAENAICKDYVSEKLGRGMSWEMIPIVYGGVNYTASLPPKSVIDITEFDSPEHLAKHLKFLSENESEYAKYFEWKGKYGMKRVTKTMAMCDLCQKLHDPTYHKTYPDIVKWWKKDTCSTSFMDDLKDRGLV